uniref:ATP synthase c subunit lysine N-methyltransferase n=1 Tax=Geospiza parvula TaxID=87175 RepID=A0A8C3MEZ4_GEOPR
MSENTVCLSVRPSPGAMCPALAKEAPQEEGEGGSRRSGWGLLVTAGVGGTLVALYAVATPFVTPALRKVCLPFVPATATQIQNVLKMLENRSGSLVDIGSGDGRIVIAAAKKGFQAVGYELNPWLVWYSRYRAWRDGVHQNTKFYISDLWKVSSELCKNGSGMIERFYEFGNAFPKKLKYCLTTRYWALSRVLVLAIWFLLAQHAILLLLGFIQVLPLSAEAP